MTADPVPSIAPKSIERRWSVMVPTYNCAHLLAATLDSVLAQDLGVERMQIAVIDDCSTDDPEGVVAAYGGRVEFVRNRQNLGAVANFNACLDHSTGELVHILHGDDLVHPGFYSAFDLAFDDPAILAAATRVDIVDQHGVVAKTTRSERDGSGPWNDALDVLAVSNRVFAPALVARRKAYEQVGGFRTDLPHAADWEMWARLAAHGRIWFQDEVLASYRVHPGQDTGPRTVSGHNIVERREAVDTIIAYLPPQRRPRRRRQALAYSALFAARTSWDLVRSGHHAGALRQLAQAVRCLAAIAAPP